jgi:hypothetical protein
VFDGDERLILQDIAYKLCDLLNDHSFPQWKPNDPQYFVATLLRHQVHEDTFFIGAIDRSSKQIRMERMLQKSVRKQVSEKLKNYPSEKVPSHEAFRREVRDLYLTADSDLPRTKAKPQSLVMRWKWFVGMVLAFLLFPIIGVLSRDIRDAVNRISSRPKRLLAKVVLAIWWIYGFLPTALSFLITRVVEIVERPTSFQYPDEEIVQELELAESLATKNNVTLLFDVKQSIMRRLLLRVILFGADIGCKYFWTNGELADVGTINYARIIQFDKGRRMLFLSDYDGGIDGYLDDFLNIGGRAVIAITSNLEGCPKVKWLFLKEKREDFNRFWKLMIRKYQLRTAVWYQAYPSLPVKEILENASIRDGLFSETLSKNEAQEWTRRI